MELFKIFGTVGLKGVDDVNSQLDGVTGKAEKSSGSIGISMKKIAGAIGLGFGVSKIVGFGKSVISTTQSFSDAMLKVQSLSGASEEELKKLNDTALEYGSTTAWTSSQVADAMGYMALAGFDTNEIMDSLGGTLSLASASGTDLAVASDILTDSLTAFGYGAKDANLFSNVLATTQAKSNTTVEMLGESFKYVGTLAGAYKYSIEDVSSALGLMANSGIKGSMAGTSLASIITRLANNTNGATDTLKKMGIEFYNSDGSARDLGTVINELCVATEGMTASEKASIASKIAGQEAQKGLLAILNQGSGVYNELNETLKQCDNSAGEMANTMESGMGGAMRSMASAWEGFKIKIGQKIEPGITKVLHALASFVTNTLVPAMENLIDVIGSVIGWFGKHKNITTALVTAMGALTTAYATFKAGAKIQGIVNMWQQAKVQLALYSMEMKGATIAEGLLNGQLGIGSAVVGLLTGQISLSTLATTLWTKAQNKLNIALTANPIGVVIMAIGALIAIIVVLYNKCETFRNFVNSVFETLKPVFENAMKNIKALFDEIKPTLDELMKSFSELRNTLVNLFGELWKLIQPVMEVIIKVWINILVTKIKLLITVLKPVITVVSKILTVVIKVVTKIVEIVSSFVNLLTGKFKGFGDGIKNTFGSVINWFTNIWSNLGNIIAKPFTWAWERIKSFGNAVSNFFSNLWGNITGMFSNIGNWFKSTFKLPHFSFSGSWNPVDWFTKGEWPGVSVEWYKNGGIMTQPTLFGMNPLTGSPMVGGEAGAEAILPIDNLQTYVTNAVRSENASLVNVLNRTYDLLASVLPEIKNKELKAILDSGALVSGTVDKMDTELGNKATRKSRFGV